MDVQKIEKLANFHSILDFDEVVETAEETFDPDVFQMNYENMSKLQAMCIQRFGYEGRMKAIKAAYAYGLLRGMIATKKGFMQAEIKQEELKPKPKQPVRRRRNIDIDRLMEKVLSGF